MKVKLATIKGVEVPGNLRRDLKITSLDNKILENIIVCSEDGIQQQISATDIPGRYTIHFNGLAPQTSTSLIIEEMVYQEEIAKAPVPKAEPPAMPPEEPVIDIPDIAPRKKIDLLKEKKRQRIKTKSLSIRSGAGLRPSRLNGLRVLTFGDANCWARALGMAQKSYQLQYALGVPLIQYYDRITAQGDGAIIAAAIACGIDFDRYFDWYTNTWRAVFTPNPLIRMKRFTKRFFKNEVGFDASQAEKAILKLFTQSGTLLRMKDTKIPLHITTMQADMEVTVFKSEKHDNLTIAEAVIDAAVTRLNFNQKSTIKDESLFLGAPDKNDSFRLLLSAQNQGLQVTSIDAPVRVDPEGAISLEKENSDALNVTMRNAQNHVSLFRARDLMKKLNEQGNADLNLHELYCKPIDHIVRNSTTQEALEAGRESGSGMIVLPDFIKQSLKDKLNY